MFSIKVITLIALLFSQNTIAKNARYFSYEKKREKFAKGQVNLAELKSEFDLILSENQDDPSFMKVLQVEYAMTLQTNKIIKKTDSEKIKFLSNFFYKYLTKAKQDFHIGSFESFYIQADYLRGIIKSLKNHQQDDLVIAMEQILTYLGANSEFRYQQALKISKQIRNKKFKKKYDLIMKRLTQIETRESDPNELSEDEKYFLNQ